MKTLSRYNSILLPFILLLITGLFCNEIAYSSALLEYGGEIVLPVNEAPTFLDPLFAASPVERLISSQTYEGLLRIKPTGELESALADSWESFSGDTEIVFRLKKGISFHDGTQLTSDVVVKSLERLASPSHKAPQNWILDPVLGIKEFRTGKTESISGIQNLDSSTLKISLSTTAPDFIKNLGLLSASIVSFSTVNNTLSGTGPFEIKSHSPSGVTLLKANSLYYSGRPCIDSLTLIPMPQDENRLLEFERGKLTATPIPESEFRRLSRDPKHKDYMVKTNIPRMSYLGCNMTRKPMNDVRFRQALSMAINRDDMLLMILNGHGKIMNQFFPFEEQQESFLNYSPESSQNLYSHILSKPVRLLIPNNSNSIRNLAQKISWNAQVAGIPMVVDELPFNQYRKTVQSGNYDLYYGTYRLDTPYPDVFLNELLVEPSRGTLGNSTFFYSSEFLALLNHYRLSSSAIERKTDLEHMNELLCRQLPIIPLLTYNEYWVYQESLQNAQNMADPIYNLRYLWIKKPIGR